MDESLPCIVCDKLLYRVLDDYELQPNDAVMCSTTGNYGSTVFDPMGQQTLHFNICDTCIVKLRDKGVIALADKRYPSAIVPWKEGL